MYLSPIFLAGIPFIGLAIASSANPLRPIIDLGYARYQGIYDETVDVTHFFGVRYAASTAGTRRWTAPETPTPTQELLQATEQPNFCPWTLIGRTETPPSFLSARVDNSSAVDSCVDNPLIGHADTQFPFLSDQADNSSVVASCHKPLIARVADTPPVNAGATDVDEEDCLVLNIYVPGNLSSGKDAKLPILVYMHAGGYVYGGAKLYTGDDIVQESGGNVIFIVLQYRLGLFGFLSGDRVHESGVLNAGLLDQQFAFKWIQEHAQVLGGDPSRVTIWGDSAGGGSVLLHMVANGGKTNPPLFLNGIASSPYFPPQYPFNHSIPEAVYSEVVAESGCSSAVDTLSCLRSTDIAILKAVNWKLATSAFYGTTMFNPVLDGNLINQLPSQSLKEGKVNGKALLSVHNTLEGSLFVNETTASRPDADLRTFVSWVLPDLSAQHIDEAVARYGSLGTTYEQMSALMGEVIFICPSYFILTAFPGNSYKAEFAVGEGRHLDDVPYYFPSLTGPILPFGAKRAPIFNNSDFKTAFTSAFLDFAIFSNLNKKLTEDNITPPWPASNFKSPSRMLFNQTADGTQAVVKDTPVPSDLMNRCAFWESVSDEIWQ